MNCKNCGKSLEDLDDSCSNCGGKVIRNRLTLKNLFHQINETYFNYDNKLLRTFVNSKQEDKSEYKNNAYPFLTVRNG